MSGKEKLSVGLAILAPFQTRPFRFSSGAIICWIKFNFCAGFLRRMRRRTRWIFFFCLVFRFSKIIEMVRYSISEMTYGPICSIKFSDSGMFSSADLSTLLHGFPNSFRRVG